MIPMTPARVRAFVDGVLAESPELFPSGMAEGYELHGFGRASRKLDGARLRKWNRRLVHLRRIARHFTAG